MSMQCEEEAKSKGSKEEESRCKTEHRWWYHFAILVLSI